jgi:acyl carrier protein
VRADVSAETVLSRLQRILCDLLVLKPEDVHPESLLVDDLDADSIAMIELMFAIEQEFGVKLPDLKADEETFALPLPDGLRRLEETPGTTTFFEYLKHEAICHVFGSVSTIGDMAALLGVALPPGRDPSLPVSRLLIEDVERLATAAWEDAPRTARAFGAQDFDVARLASLLTAPTRDALFRKQNVATLARAAVTRVPEGMDPNASVSKLRLRDLFRFFTVGAMAGYVIYLLASETG